MRKPNHCEPVVGNPTPRVELLAKINAVTAGMCQWHELLTAMVEAFPPTTDNLAQVAKLGASLLVQEGMELAALSRKLTEPGMPPAVVARMGEGVRS